MFEGRKNQYHILKCEKVIFKKKKNLGSTGALREDFEIIKYRRKNQKVRNKTREKKKTH